MRRFLLILGAADAEEYGDSLHLDLDKLDEFTDCETLMAWEEECDYSYFLIKRMVDSQPARWKRAVLWFALKQAGSDIRFADLKLRSPGRMWLKLDTGDADPPAPTSSEDESGPASSTSTRGSRRTTSSRRGKSAS